MKITILSIGKFDNSPFLEIWQYYLKRLKWKVIIRELEIKNSNGFEDSKIKTQEGLLLIKNFDNFDKIIALDENGKQFSSIEFANLLQNYSVNSNGNIAFVIGGALGMSQEVKERADLILSFSKFTFPHLMVRGILIEQIYRASTIIANHPYHKN